VNLARSLGIFPTPFVCPSPPPSAPDGHRGLKGEGSGILLFSASTAGSGQVLISNGIDAGVGLLRALNPGLGLTSGWERLESRQIHFLCQEHTEGGLFGHSKTRQAAGTNSAHQSAVRQSESAGLTFFASHSYDDYCR
jgi:hypothetical protein